MNARHAIRHAASLGLIRPLDAHFAELIDELSGGAADGVLLAATLISRQTGEGDVCLHLPDWAGKTIFKELPELSAPSLGEWRAMLASCPVVSGSDAERPLVLEDNALYLARYWVFETGLATALRSRAEGSIDGIDRTRLSRGLQRLLGDSEAAAGQRQAAALAVLRRLAVISGGPGTGKTRTVAAILALLLEQNPDLRIALAAPTGKAAARLSESIQAAKFDLPLEEATRIRIPERTYTLHRLLGMMPGRSRPRHDAKNRLHVDLLVIDEASMIDLPLLARVLDALPPSARLIMLGDRNQLASVEAGAVLGDICGHSARPRYSRSFREELKSTAGATDEFENESVTETSSMADSIATLEHSYRFSSDSGIGALARAINAGDANAVLALLEAGAANLRLLSPSSLEMYLGRHMTDMLEGMLGASGPGEALASLGRIRILCAVREGPFGVVALNALVERFLRRHFGLDTHRQWYQGRPVMIQGNDYALNLFNGDIGIAWPDEEGRMRVYFDGPGEAVRMIHPGRMPAHETVYAMTVHKSQGSEFDEVLLVLPRQDVRVLTRELFYTGVTRARNRVTLWADPPIVAAAVNRCVRRTSRLRERLWGG